MKLELITHECDRVFLGEDLVTSFGSYLSIENPRMFLGGFNLIKKKKNSLSLSLSLSHGDLNPDSYPLHSINTYTCKMTIIPQELFKHKHLNIILRNLTLKNK